MWYVYIIRSVNFSEQEYVGATADLNGDCRNTMLENRHIPQNSSLGGWFGTALSRTSTKR